MRLDLHCHSTASDGTLNMWELVELATKVGLDGLVITDHCSPDNAFHTNQVILDAVTTNSKLKIPVIIGSEIDTPYGEFLLFGKKACGQWDHYKYDLRKIAVSFGVESYWNMFNTYVLHKITHSTDGGFLSSKVIQPLEYSMIMCHPRKFTTGQCGRFPDIFWMLLNGFEIQNGYEHYDITMPDVVDFLKSRIRNCKCLRNSDTHNEELGTAFNEIDIKEVSENHLIHWLRN